MMQSVKKGKISIYACFIVGVVIFSVISFIYKLAKKPLTDWFD
jgi:hypothetical protein